MKTTHGIITLVLIVAFVIARGTGAGTMEEEEKKLCKKVSMKVLKQIVKELTICNSQMKNQTKDMKEHSKKMGCVVKCILKAETLLDEKEMVTNATIDRTIGDRASGKIRLMAITKFQECNTKFGSTLDPTDPLCTSYATFGNCIQVAVVDLCEKLPST